MAEVTGEAIVTLRTQTLEEQILGAQCEWNVSDGEGSVPKGELLPMVFHLVIPSTVAVFAVPEHAEVVMPAAQNLEKIREAVLLEADRIREARQILRNQHLIPVDIEGGIQFGNQHMRLIITAGPTYAARENEVFSQAQLLNYGRCLDKLASHFTLREVERLIT